MRISDWSLDVCSSDLAFAFPRRGFGMASNRMLQFVARDQQYPDKRSPDARARDFREIADRYAAPQASEQSSRCEQCGVPYCSVHCPLQNHIPDWFRLTADGRLREASERSEAHTTD